MIFIVMNKDLKKLIVETINDTFTKAPEKLIQRGVREIYYDICPHCKQEIHEKHEYTEDGGTTWRHSDCGGLIARPETPSEGVADWLRPYVKEARDQRKAARHQLGLADLPDNEPGGTMSAVNTVSIANESSTKKSERTEVRDVQPQDFARFMEKTINVVNASNFPVNVTITEFTSTVNNQSAKAFIIRINNG